MKGRSSVVANTRSFASGAALATRYVLSSTARHKGGACVGVITVALVVCFASLLQAVIQHAPFIFLRLAQDSVGQNDVVYIAESSNTSTSPLLNFTGLEDTLVSNPDVVGAAPRWLLLANLVNRDNSALNTTVIVLIIDSEREEAAGIGTQWNRRPLGEDEAYVSDTALGEVDVPGGVGAKAVLRLEVQQLLTSLVYGADLTNEDGGFTADALRDTLDSFGITIDPISLSVSDALVELLSLLGISTENVPGDLGTVELEAEVLLAAALNATFASDLNSEGSAAIERTVTVTGGVGKPKGKWPTALGNVVVLEAKHMTTWVRSIVTDALDSVRDLASLLGLGQEWDESVQPIRDALEDLNYDLLKQYAMQGLIMYNDRVDLYVQDSKGIKAGMRTFTDSLMDTLGVEYPVSVTAPIATTLEGTSFIAIFLNLIFLGTVVLLMAMGAMVIYALVLGDVEAKTYEYGMLRVLGLRHGTLAVLLMVQTCVFSIPGIAVGLIAAALMNLGVSAVVSDFAGISARTDLPPVAVWSGVVVGAIMPALANVVPIRRALSSTLRDAIDLYHQSFNDVKVVMMKLAKLGLSPLQLALAVLMVAVGFTTFFLIPLSFVLRDFALFLGILNAILLGMVLGLSFMAQAIQFLAERAVLWLLLWREETRLWTVITKNLAGHRSRNKKTAYMITIAVSFLVFAGAMFALQARSLKDNVRVFVGSDLLVLDLTSGDGLPQEDMISYLDTAKVETDGVDATVYDYTFVTHPLGTYPSVGETLVSNLAQLPEPETRVFGLQENYLDVCWKQFQEVTDAQSSSDASDIVRALHTGAGQIVLPVEAERPTAPPPISTGVRARYTYVCNATSPQEAKRLLTEGEVPVYWSYSLCVGVCPGPCTGATTAETSAELAQDVSDSYSQYIDVVASEAMQPLASLNAKRPLRFSVESVATTPLGTSVRQRVYLAKARGFVSKLPGFFFSSYRPTAFNAPLVVRMQSFGALLSNVQRDTALIRAGQGFAPPPEDDSNSGDSGPGSPISGGDSSDSGGSVTPTEATIGEPVWLPSQPSWVIVNDTTPADVDYPASAAFDNADGTFAKFPPPAPPAVMLINMGACLATDSIRITTPRAASAVVDWTLEAATTPAGPFLEVAQGTVESSEEGAPQAFAFLLFSSQYWRITLQSSGGDDGVSVASIEFRLAAASLCDAGLLLEDDLALGVSKRKLHIRLLNSKNKAAKERVLNALRNVLDSDLSTIADTQSILKNTDDVAAGLQGFFTFVSALCLILIFFSTWLSFDSNLRENSREFGILRSLGLSKARVTRVYLYEALSVVLSSFLLGTAIGMFVAITLTLQFNLFTEMPFRFEFPYLLVFFTFSMSIVVAIVSSLVPARTFSRLGIANVVKGRTS